MIVRPATAPAGAAMSLDAIETPALVLDDAYEL
jgi:hypothetical protein